VNLADLYPLLADHLAAAFATSAAAAYPSPPDKAAAPAAWVEIPNGSSSSGQRNVLTATARTVVVLGQTDAGPTLDAQLDAVDRLVDAWRTPPAGVGLAGGWAWALEERELGGVSYNAVSFDVPVNYPANC
jgi:hypothetical protein